MGDIKEMYNLLSDTTLLWLLISHFTITVFCCLNILFLQFQNKIVAQTICGVIIAKVFSLDELY